MRRGKDLDKQIAGDLKKTEPAKDGHAPADPLRIGGPPERQKVILKKDGFALPDTILVSYKVLDGKYRDKDSNALRFEDHGKRLSTPVEDRAVIKDMIAVATAKNWGKLELKGTDTFKQWARLEAESRGRNMNKPDDFCADMACGRFQDSKRQIRSLLST